MQIILIGKYLYLLVCIICLFITKCSSQISSFSSPKDIKTRILVYPEYIV